MRTREDMIDRAKGCLIGLAVGDALGTTLEFSTRDSKPPVTSMIGGGPFALKAGQWTDDTSMALCLGESLLQCGQYNPYAMMDSYGAWMRDGHNSVTGKCFDIGITTRFAIQNYIDEGIPYDGPSDPRSAGNGSIMRLAPSVLCSLGDPVRAVETSVLQSRPTHAAPEALEACALMGSLLYEDITGSMTPDIELAEPNIKAIAQRQYRGKNRDEIKSSGYVVHTLEAALWALSETDNFQDAVLLAVNLGDDADTLGAVTGQLAGARYGYKAIPDDWKNTLAWEREISEMAVSLVNQGLKAAPTPRGELTPQPPIA